MLPSMHDGLSALLMEVLGPFRRSSVCRHVHRELMRNELLDLITIVPTNACWQRNKYPPAKPEVLRLLAPQRGLTAIAKSKPKTEKTTNGRLPELSNFESPPAEPGVYHD